MPYIRKAALEELLGAGNTLAHYSHIMNNSISKAPQHEKNGVSQAENRWIAARTNLIENPTSPESQEEEGN